MFRYKLIVACAVILIMLGCASKKNTSTTRAYHSINTRYNIYFNANEAYKESLKSKQTGYQDNLSQIISIYPSSIEEEDIKQKTGGSFDVTVDKTTKAIKIHSIRSKPERDPAKRKNQEYQAWLKQQEFNPFLKNAWLLLGKAEFQNEDYLQSVSTLSYITRLYKGNNNVVTEARIWMAKAYNAMGWFYEAEDIFHKIKLAGGVPDNLATEYNKVYTDFLVKKKEYDKAIPFLEQAIKSESDGLQKIRMKYLLGQLYSYTHSQEKAYQAFESVTGLNTPYLYSFNAKIQQASFVNSSNQKEILSLLSKMGKDPKNKEYLDQVHYAIGNIYLNNQDTAKAVNEYERAVKESTRNGYDKALNQVILGDIYFAQQKYAKAQPNYSEALSSISKKHEAYPRVNLRSEVLDELVVHIEAIHLQDSLQYLAQKPYEEQVAVVAKIISNLKKKEEEEKKEQQKTEQANNSSFQNPNSPFFEQSSPNIPSSPVNIGGNSSSFYFYNPQLVNQGKVTFQRKWGTRKLEDNWRRSNKRVTTFDEEIVSKEEETDLNTSSETPETKTPASDDVYSPEFYLQQIPMTPEAIKASNEIIEDAYFNLGKIYKDKLGDYNLAIEAFMTNLSRFPDGPNREEIYYQLFLIYLKLGDKDMTEVYRRLLLNAFPKSSYAAALSDPNYEWNLRNMHKMEDDLYQQTYEAYLGANIKTVRTNYQSMTEKYPLSPLIPKFMFLNALTYAQTNDPEEFKTQLRELIEKHPKADVTPLASDMLKGILGGKTLSSDSSPARGMLWDIRFGTGENMDETAGVDFIADRDTEHMLLFIYKSQTIDKNQLIYDVASYNFSSFIYQTFDLSFSETNSLELLQVKGFKSLNEIEIYIDKAFEKNSLMSELDPSIIPLPISTDNFVALMNGKSLNEYFLFFEKNYTKEMLKLIMYWNQQRSNNPVKEEETTKPKVEETTPVEVEPEGKSIVTPTTPVKPPYTKVLVDEENENDSKNKEIGAGDILSDEQIEEADKVINTTIDIINNPVDGLKNLFNSSGDKVKLTKEEKAAKRAEDRRIKEEEKQRKAKAKAEEQAIKNAEQAKIDSIANAKKQEDAKLKAEEDAKLNQQKEAVKAKENARKQRQQELKEKEKAQKEKLKERERERKERLKRREAESKAKEKANKK